MSLLKFLPTSKSLVGMSDNTSRYRMRPRKLLPNFGLSKNPFALPPKPGTGELPFPAPAARAVPARMETRPLFENDQDQEHERNTEAPSLPAREIKVSMPRSVEAVKVEIKKVEAKAEESFKDPPPGGTIVKRGNPPLPTEKGQRTLPSHEPAGNSPGPQLPAAAIQPAAPAKAAAKPRGWFAWVKNLNPVSVLPRLTPGGMASRGRTGRKAVQGELSLDRVQVVRNDLRETDLEIVPGRLMGLPSGASPVLASVARPESSGLSRLASRIMGVEQTHS